MEQGKSIEELIQHIRENHKINIEDSDKQDLLNMGYFHGYKAYKFVKNKTKPIDITDFREIKNIYRLDNKLKELFYLVVMEIETAINNNVIDCVVANDEVELNYIIRNKLNHYEDFVKNSKQYNYELVKHLRLEQNIHTIIANRYVQSPILQHYIIANKQIPLWAIFEYTTLGDLAYFIERLNDETRCLLHKKIGVFDKRYDTDNTLLAKHVYIIKDLRNGLAHNSPIFDCRFKNANINKTVIAHLQQHTSIDRIDFSTITDYVILLAYYMKILKFDRREVHRFILNYSLIVDEFKGSNNQLYNKIFGVDTQSKLQKFLLNY